MTTEKKNLLNVLSEKHQVEGVDLDELVLDLKHLSVIPYDIAKKNLILPISVAGDSIVIAMADPSDDQIKKELTFVTGAQVSPRIALPEQLETVIRDCYTAYHSGETEYQSRHTKTSKLPDTPPKRQPKNNAPTKNTALQEEGGVDSNIDIDIASPQFTPKLSSIIPGVAAELQGLKSRPPMPDFRKKILVVDDEKEILILISKVLKSKGYQIITTERGLDAIQKIQSEQPDLVILDAMLPEIHGFDICKQIKQDDNYNHIPVIMISAIYRGWRYAKDLQESYGVDVFIEKPFNIEELVSTVEKYCDGAGVDGEESAPDNSQAIKEALVTCKKMYRTGDIDNAISHLQKATKKDATSFDLHYTLALLLGKKGFRHRAILSLETALGLKPNNFLALKNLAVLYQRSSFKLKAIETWERTLETCPDEQTREGIKRHLVGML